MQGLACLSYRFGTVVGAPACLQLKETRVVNDNLVAQLERLKQEKAALVQQVTQLRQSCQERAAQNTGLCMQVGSEGSPPGHQWQPCHACKQSCFMSLEAMHTAITPHLQFATVWRDSIVCGLLCQRVHGAYAGAESAQRHTRPCQLQPNTNRPSSALP